MKKKCFLSAITLIFTSCATMNDSLQLGAGMGAATGTAATYVGYKAGGQSPDLGTVALGASIGAAVGMITSYFTHKKIEEQRQSYQSDQTEMHFGDLPPSPFIVPRMNIKKGGK